MAKPIEIYKESLKEFGVEEAFDVSQAAKQSFIQVQTAEQRNILNRLIFDYTIAKYHFELEEDEGLLKDAHRKKMDDYRSDIRQIMGALKVNIELNEGLKD